VERPAARGLADLLAAAEAVREEGGFGSFPDGRQEDPLGAGHGDLVVAEAEASRHAAAAFEEAGVGSEEAPVGVEAHDRVVMAMGLDQDGRLEGRGLLQQLGKGERLDVNPTSAGWVWMPTATLVKGMRTFDTVENRGYVLVELR